MIWLSLLSNHEEFLPMEKYIKDNIDLTFYFNAKFATVLNNLEQDLVSMYNSINYKQCIQEREILQDKLSLAITSESELQSDFLT